MFCFDHLYVTSLLRAGCHDTRSVMWMCGGLELDNTVLNLAKDVTPACNGLENRLSVKASQSWYRRRGLHIMAVIGQSRHMHMDRLVLSSVPQAYTCSPLPSMAPVMLSILDHSHEPHKPTSFFSLFSKMFLLPKKEGNCHLLRIYCMPVSPPQADLPEILSIMLSFFLLLVFFWMQLAQVS